VDVVSNENPDTVKQWLTIGLKSDVLYGSSFTFTPEIDVPSTQTLANTDFVLDSGVIDSNERLTTASPFKFKEQQLYASYMRTKDSASANYVEGKKLKGFWQKTRIRFNGGGTKIYKVFSVIFKYVNSNYTR